MWDRIARKLGHRNAVASGPVEVRVCRVTWQYEHPPAALERETEADTSSFQAWILADAEIDADEISRRELVSLYAEFCDVHNLRPMPWGRFDRSLKGAGFERFRSSLPRRPWCYRAIRPGSALVFKLPPPVVASSERAAA
jgi:hypothetical protein